MMKKILFLLLLPANVVVAQKQQQGGFNYEIEKRVHERVTVLMSLPVRMNGLTERYITTGTFPDFLNPRDRDAYFKFMFSLSMEYQQDVFYGQEDGLFMGYVKGSGSYLEPAGSSGYRLWNDTGIPRPVNPRFQKYYGACIDPNTGERENCNMEEGDEFIQCIDNCTLEVCASDENSKLQTECSLLPAGSWEKSRCEEAMTWCPKYQRRSVLEGQVYGYVPRYWYCVDKAGAFTEEENDVFSPAKMEGTCKYGDGVTRVNGTTNEEVDYAYCGGNGETCSNMFTGGYQSRRYDHRMRAWYEKTRMVQKSFWSAPYPFATNLDIGVTYITPVFSTIDRKRVYRGALTVNYALEDISQFLVEEFANSSASIVIYEEQEPNYLIGTSTGFGVARKVLSSDMLTLCPQMLGNDCEVVRAKTTDLIDVDNGDHPMNVILLQALLKQKEEGHPKRLVVSKGSSNDVGSDSFVSQSLIYEQPGANLEWRIVVVMPTEKATTSDSILVGTPVSIVLCVVSLLGFVGCFALFFAYYRKRDSKEVAISDVRFTSMFIIGCAFLNVSTLTLLGPTTDVLCMLRMWWFHLLFVATLTPLLAKVWRMHKLVGAAAVMRKKVITHTTATLYMMPVILSQVIILILFSIFEPPIKTEYIDINGGQNMQHVICGRKTNAFFITQLLFEGGLVLAGCILAFLTRNLGSNLGEAKPLIFAMYNIALVAVIGISITRVMKTDQASTYVVVSLGLLWATLFSSCFFVLPRLLRIQRSAGLQTLITRVERPANASNLNGALNNNSRPANASRLSCAPNNNTTRLSCAPNNNTKSGDFHHSNCTNMAKINYGDCNNR